MESIQGFRQKPVTELIQSIDNSVRYFYNDNKAYKLIENLKRLKVSVENSSKSIEEIEKFVHDYDFDEETPANGYRSFIDVFNSAVQRAIKIGRKLITAREKTFFRVESYSNDINEWNEIFECLTIICNTLVELHRGSTQNSLYTEVESPDNILTKAEKRINQNCFYGEKIAFQFCPSMRPIIKFVVTSMASYYNFYFDKKPKAIKVLCFSNSFVNYLLRPKKRAAKYLYACENSSTKFCRSFWFLNEGRLAHTLPSLVGYKVEVNKVFQIPSEPLEIFSEKLNKFVNIPQPKSHIDLNPISCRLFSAKRRKGMIGVKTKSQDDDASKYLIFHVHGGGWAAQSPKSHEIYLREWAVKLNIPILSVDYSLSPEAPFPRAVEEVFYAYCWVLNYPGLVGSTCENVVFVGDSAGANLNTVCAGKSIEMGIAKPKGIFNIYGTFSIGSSVTPAIFMSLIDPILPFGFITRLTKSYCEQQEKLELNGTQTEVMSKKQAVENKRKKPKERERLSDCTFKIQSSHLISPHWTPDEILREFPPTTLLSTNLDPCLDDSIELGRKLKKLGVNVQVDIISGLPHGFLHFDQISKECHDASMVCMDRIKSLLEM